VRLDRAFNRNVFLHRFASDRQNRCRRPSLVRLTTRLGRARLVVRVTPSNSSASFWNGVGKRDGGVRRLRRDDEIERHGGEVIGQAAEAWHTLIAAPPDALVFGGIRDVGLPRPKWARPAAARSRSWAELVPRLRGIATLGWSCGWICFAIGTLADPRQLGPLAAVAAGTLLQLDAI
jgi:hypothetical protein